jgi:hypothetical protein
MIHPLLSARALEAASHTDRASIAIEVLTAVERAAPQMRGRAAKTRISRNLFNIDC